MSQCLTWLSEVGEPPWNLIAEASRSDFPIPNGFVVCPGAGEEAIRQMYEELKIREKTHYVAVRGAEMSFLNLLGGDRLIHTIKTCWAQSKEKPVLLIQRMVYSLSCGTIHWNAKRLKIEASPGLMMFEPDKYVVEKATERCVRRSVSKKRNEMIRSEDGTTRIVERTSIKAVLDGSQIHRLLEVAVGVKNHFGRELHLTWAMDERKLWVLSIKEKRISPS